MELFHTEIQEPVFLSVGPDVKLDVFKNFDLDKPFDLHLDPPTSENPPLCRITQEGKDPIITTDFYLTNVEPREWIFPTLMTNDETATSTAAAAAASNFTPEIPQIQFNQEKLDFILGCCTHHKLQFWILEVKM